MTKLATPSSSPPTTCAGCGACCARESVPPFMPNELDVLAPTLRREVEKAIKAGVPTGGCLWYDREKKTCLHYEDRPEVCRQFELGGEECVELWSRLAAVSVKRTAQPPKPRMYMRGSES